MPSFTPERAMPLRWPAAWNAAQLETLKASPVNCIVDAPPAVADAARASGFTAITRNDAADVIRFVPDPVWPGIRLARRGQGADAGPTGAPWVDANAWSIQLTQALNPGKLVWVEAAPEKGVALNDASYLMPIAEAAVYGARQVLTLDDAFAKGFANGDAAMNARWQKMMSTIQFFTEWRVKEKLQLRANLAVISDFAGDNEFLAKEFLNLAARRNISYRIAPAQRAVVALTAPPAPAVALYLDAQPPAAELAAALKTFAREGGFLIASGPSDVASWGEHPGASPIPGYRVTSFGKGRIATPAKAWEDPWVVAAEVRILMGGRTDVLRLYNAGPMGALYARSPDGRSGLIHLLNYVRRPIGDAVTVAPADPYQRAVAISLEHPKGEIVKIAKRPQRFSEIPVPAFGVYSAIELGQ
jgi:hypothetical protein